MDKYVEKILHKIERQLAEAKKCTSEKDVREHLLVIQSLCDVVVDDEDDLRVEPLGKSVPKIENKISELELKQMMGVDTPPVKNKNPHLNNVLEEDDANGESLFDF